MSKDDAVERVFFDEMTSECISEMKPTTDDRMNIVRYDIFDFSSLHENHVCGSNSDRGLHR